MSRFTDALTCRGASRLPVHVQNGGTRRFRQLPPRVVCAPS